MEKFCSKLLCKALSLKQRAGIIEIIEGGDYYAKISGVYHVWKAQEANIKNKEIINSLIEIGALEGIKRIRTPEYPFEEDVIKFLRWLRSLGMPVSMAIIQERALMVGQGSHVPDFKASIGWMHRLLKRSNF